MQDMRDMVANIFGGHYNPDAISYTIEELERLPVIYKEVRFEDFGDHDPYNEKRERSTR